LNNKIDSLNEEHTAVCKEYYKIIKDREEAIDALNIKINNLNVIVKEVKQTKKDDDNYTLITANNALKSNMKRFEKDIERITKERDDLLK